MSHIRWWEDLPFWFVRAEEGKKTFDRYKWAVERLPKPPAKVLEIGFSSGEALSWIASLGYDCVGVDLSEVVENITKDPAIEYFGMNVDGPDGTDYREDWSGKFDVVILLEVLQHTIFDENVLFKVWHYLKPEGHLFLSTERGKLVNKGVHYYPRDILLTMLSALRFKIDEYVVDSQPGYIWVHARKM